MSMFMTLLTSAGLVLFGLVLSVTGCAAPRIQAYRDNEPKVDIREYFDGELVAYGTVQDITGKVVSRFTADIRGSWDGDEGTLNETFTFEDGAEEIRNWTLRLNPEDGSFTGTAHDVVGEAKGEQAGNAIFMKYTLRRDINGRTIDFTMDDRLYLINESLMMNQTKMKKFGITVAELNIAFYKK
jgi:hypothetical protein